jgi:hypothetical protein
VYIRPRYLRLRRSFPGNSLCYALFDTVWNPSVTSDSARPRRAIQQKERVAEKGISEEVVPSPQSGVDKCFDTSHVSTSDDWLQRAFDDDNAGQILAAGVATRPPLGEKDCQTQGT